MPCMGGPTCHAGHVQSCAVTLIMLSPKRKFDYLRKNHVHSAKKSAKESLKKRIDSHTPKN